MSDVQEHAARLIASFVSCCLWGILLTTFVPCISSLLFSASQKFKFKPRREIKFPVVAATTLLFLVSTCSAVLAIVDVMDAFIYYQGPGGALEFFDTRNNGWKHWFLAVEDTLQVTLGDALLIYRCFVIYDRNWRAIAVPAVSWLAMAAMSITASAREATLPGAKRLNDPSMIPVLSGTLVLTFTTSVITTYLIVRRLWRAEVQMSLRGVIQAHFLSRVAIVFFETGMIYTLSVIITLGIYLSGINLEYVASLALIHIIPITCNLLLIRVERIPRSESPADGSSGSPATMKSLSTEGKFNSKAMEEV
ncbi:hypothetical protein B0H17DRAFT_1204662 [Mycena rosella]|uniref:Uncharacterized protein n=1 Tax=Mycena rosella TaxID=1033263 RepID=A0AAD7D8L4_MYCRO|nr:hypothetical protein B0H17DRAFT_1204662 [Mycena rosella]